MLEALQRDLAVIIVLPVPEQWRLRPVPGVPALRVQEALAVLVPGVPALRDLELMALRVQEAGDWQRA